MFVLPNRNLKVFTQSDSGLGAIIEFEQKEKRRLSTINDEIAFPPPAENDWDDLDRFKGNLSKRDEPF